MNIERELPFSFPGDTCAITREGGLLKAKDFPHRALPDTPRARVLETCKAPEDSGGRDIGRI